MYKLKQIPNDFIVEEVPDRKFLEEGPYLVCCMKKTNYNTEDAIQTISRSLGTLRKNISYAGNKDRNAITYQYITLFKGSDERINNLELKDIEIEPKGRLKAPLSLGDLKGNTFTITIRNLENEKTNKKDSFPNLYDKQRFSEKNVEVGRAIVKKDFEKACGLLVKDLKFGEEIYKTLEKEPNNFVEALKTIPGKILLIFVHSYQSYIWNRTVEEYLKENKEEQKDVPLVGFSDIEGEFAPIIQRILEKENITQRDFIIREFPYLSLEGTKRKMLAEIKELEIGELKKDELNVGRKKVTVKFFLGKGSYATLAVRHLLEGREQ